MGPTEAGPAAVPAHLGVGEELQLVLAENCFVSS